jgi:hypothetical protein
MNAPDVLGSARLAALIVVAGLLLAGVALRGQDEKGLRAPNGIAFSEFKGYEKWQVVAVSRTDHGIKAILANPTMIKAYGDGVPEGGRTFPEGSVIVKVEWNKDTNPVSPYPVEVPTVLKSISFIEKDYKRFPETSGWGYAQFLYDSGTRSFTAYGSDSSFGKMVCYKCHTTVGARDYIFTKYAFR